jgi:hypothetical protein
VAWSVSEAKGSDSYMTVKWLMGVAVCLLAAGAPAAAQTGAAPGDARWFISGGGGAAAVEKFGGAAMADAGMRRVWKNLDIVVEGAWIQNAVTRRQLDRAGLLANVIGQSQGGDASGDIDVPVLYGGIGARWTFDEVGMFRPYIQVTGGGVRGELKPTFTLNGADITNSVGQAGITLGDDVKGKFGSGAASGGFGLIMERERYYVDITIRLLSYTVSGERTSATRLTAGAGFRF